uniref:JmjC domain-containing protein n=1 Tax=Spongospora subterranea TaxID=70186 RepID=A0A0H5RB76_9EUKA|eukprot:CRZ11061.1 hypothetical protein [Spongospora subterranea]
MNRSKRTASPLANAGGDCRRSGRRRINSKISFESDSFKDCELLQQAIKASMITKHANNCRQIPDAPVFRPTPAEFLDPFGYIESIRDEVEDAGICKIIPPDSWKPPRLFSQCKKERFRTRIQHIHRLQEGVGFDVSDKEYTIPEYKRMADAFYRNSFASQPGSRSSGEVEEMYWKLVRSASTETVVEYGNDIDASRFGSGFPVSGSSKYVKHPWNLNNIARLPRSVIRNLDAGVSGVNVPWVYFGMLFSTFCWHAEDLWMYSINYNHFGAPKSWYGVPGSEHRKMEAAMKSQVPGLFDEEPDLAMNLVTQILPETLIASDVPVVHAVQCAGEFIITFPRAFHAGFNQGFNCTEAVNFATDDWLSHGRIAIDDCRKHCKPPVFSSDKLLIEIIEGGGHPHDKAILRVELNHIIRSQTDWRQFWRRKGVENWILLSSKIETAVDHCSLCNQFCFLSYMKCGCDNGHTFCLHHVDDDLGCKCPISKRTAYFRYEIDHLNALGESLVER